MDDDCDGIIDDGSFLNGAMYGMEYLNVASTQLLLPGTNNTRSLLFLNWGGHAASFAIYRLDPAPSQMLASGNARDFFNDFASTPVFDSDAEVGQLDAVVLLPGGSLGGAIGNQTLLFAIDGTIKLLDLATRAVSTGTLASLGIPLSAGGQSSGPFVSDRLHTGTMLLHSDHPALGEDFVLVTRENQLWLYCNTCTPSGTPGWSNPRDAKQTLCIGSSFCPGSSSADMQTLSTYRANDSSILAMTIGDDLYWSPLSTTSSGGLAFAWSTSPLPLSNFGCEQ